MKTKIEPHPYLGDGVKDFHGLDRCSICHLPRREPDDENHTLAPVPDDLAEVKARILGETEHEPLDPTTGTEVG